MEPNYRQHLCTYSTQLPFLHPSFSISENNRFHIYIAIGLNHLRNALLINRVIYPQLHVGGWTRGCDRTSLDGLQRKYDRDMVNRSCLAINADRCCCDGAKLSSMSPINGISIFPFGSSWHSNSNYGMRQGYHRICWCTSVPVQ